MNHFTSMSTYQQPQSTFSCWDMNFPHADSKVRNYFHDLFQDRDEFVGLPVQPALLADSVERAASLDWDDMTLLADKAKEASTSTLTQRENGVVDHWEELLDHQPISPSYSPAPTSELDELLQV